MKTTKLVLVVAGASLLLAGCGGARHGIVGTVVNAPLASAGTVKDAKAGINVYLQSDEAPGAAFMDPAVIGYGIPPGGRLEIEMARGFERDWEVGISQAAIMLVTGAPQQGLPGKAVGYTVAEGDNENTFVFTPTSDAGLPADSLTSPAPGSAKDPIRQRGIKVIHIGFMQSAFVNAGKRGKVKVHFFDADGNVVHKGRGRIRFIDSAVPQVLPTNFPDGVRNHNWQRIKPGETLGQTAGTVPVTLMLYARADVAPAEMVKFKAGIAGAGVLSTPQLNAMGYVRPKAIARYNGGLIVQDSDGDGKLDPATDRIIGGVIASAPKGARGQELRSLERDGKPVLSAPTETIAAKPGKRFGGAIMQLQFTGGSVAGKYHPTLALLADPDDLSSGDGSAYTYTIIVE